MIPLGIIQQQQQVSMLPSFVGASTLVFQSGSAELKSIPKPVGVQEGDLLISFAITRNIFLPAYPDADPSWTEHFHYYVGSGSALGVPGTNNDLYKLWSRFATGAEPANYTYACTHDSTTNCIAIGVAAFRDTTGIANPLAVGRATPYCPDQVGALSGEILIAQHCVAYAASNIAGTIPAGMTLLGHDWNTNGDVGMIWAYEIVATDGATGSRTFPSQWSTYGAWTSLMVKK